MSIPYIPDFTTLELDYVIEKNDITSSYIDFTITGYSKKWKKFDLSFEYRLSDSVWQNDAVLTSTSASIYEIKNNKIYNLDASEIGTNNTFRWYYSSNNIPKGWSPEIRTNIVPRLTTYSFSGIAAIETTVFGEGIVNLGEIGNNKCLGKDSDGNYICINSNLVLIYEDLSMLPIKTYTASNMISHVISTLAGDYFIAIEDDNLIIKTDNNFNILNSYGVLFPSYLDYSENNTLLITSTLTNTVQEIYWDDIISLTWTYPNILNAPQSATYSIYQNNKILIATNGTSNSIIVHDRYYNTDKIITAYYHRNNSKILIKPFKAYYVNEYDIVVIEKDNESIVSNTGHGIGFMIIGVSFIVG